MADLFQTCSEIKFRKFGEQGTTLKVQSLKDMQAQKIIWLKDWILASTSWQ